MVTQWMGIRLPVQGMQVQSLVREEPTYLGAAIPCATTTEAPLLRVGLQ